jgi:hypothetical protein
MPETRAKVYHLWPEAQLAVTKWLELHQATDQHIGPLARGFGDHPWNGNNEVDRALLPLLNQYCFRCHSSIRYHVIQREAVLARRDQIISRVDSDNMPPDRKLDTGKLAEDKEKILDLMRKLQ